MVGATDEPSGSGALRDAYVLDCLDRIYAEAFERRQQQQPVVIIVTDSEYL